MSGIKSVYARIQSYIYDSSIDIKERTFMLFSGTVLVALFLAVPLGLIMGEPPSATISSLIGAVFFTLYVIYAFKRKRIKNAKILISIILIFIFLPAMFFTNGGVETGNVLYERRSGKLPIRQGMTARSHSNVTAARSWPTPKTPAFP